MEGKTRQNVQKNIDLEEKIILLNDRLEELTNEKEFFLQLASHELKSPLRKIATFIDMLESNYSGDNPADALNYLQRIRNNITSMQSIIDGITELNSIARGTLVENCDLNKALTEALGQLSGPINESNAIIRVCALPAIEANFLNMKVLFNNLLSNSIKFRSRVERPHIDISYSELTIEEKNSFNLLLEKTYYKIKFADNGIGFSQNLASKLFEPFVKLNGKSEFPGNGLGLSICRKIVELQGGILYGESYNAGSTFTLILSKLANDAESGEGQSLDN
jgi:signal transduction histidine kinase